MKVEFGPSLCFGLLQKKRWSPQFVEQPETSQVSLYLIIRPNSRAYTVQLLNFSDG